MVSATLTCQLPNVFKQVVNMTSFYLYSCETAVSVFIKLWLQLLLYVLYRDNILTVVAPHYLCKLFRLPFSHFVSFVTR